MERLWLPGIYSFFEKLCLWVTQSSSDNLQTWIIEKHDRMVFMTKDQNTQILLEGFK